MRHELGGIGHVTLHPMPRHMLGSCDEEFDLEGFITVKGPGEFASQDFLVDIVHLSPAVLDNPRVGRNKE